MLPAAVAGVGARINCWVALHYDMHPTKLQPQQKPYCHTGYRFCFNPRRDQGRKSAQMHLPVLKKKLFYITVNWLGAWVATVMSAASIGWLESTYLMLEFF